MSTNTCITSPNRSEIIVSYHIGSAIVARSRAGHHTPVASRRSQRLRTQSRGLQPGRRGRYCGPCCSRVRTWHRHLGRRAGGCCGSQWERVFLSLRAREKCLPRRVREGMKFVFFSKRVEPFFKEKTSWDEGGGQHGGSS